MYITRNENNKYTGECKCIACKNSFKFKEGEDTYVLVSDSSTCNGAISLDLDIVSKCPHCEHNVIFKRKSEFKR